MPAVLLLPGVEGNEKMRSLQSQSPTSPGLTSRAIPTSGFARGPRRNRGSGLSGGADC